MSSNDVLRQLLAALISASGGEGSGETENFRLRFSETSPMVHVVDGGRGISAHSVGRSVSLTNETFESTADVDVTMRTTLARGAVAVGLVAANIDPTACRLYCIGERRAPLSIACLVCRGECLVVCGDDIKYRTMQENEQDPTDVRMTVKDGCVGFYVDEKFINCPFLKGKIAGGAYRVAASLIGVGAKAVLHRVSLGGGVSLADCCRSTGVRDEGRTIFCRTTRRATNFSRQTYTLETLDATFVCTIRRRMGGYVFLGILPEGATVEAPNFNCGDPGIASSISCGVRNGEAVLMKDGNFFFVAPCNTTDPVEIRMTLRRGSLSFAVGDVPLRAAALEGVTLAGSIRVGVSLTVEGQEATIHRA